MVPEPFRAPAARLTLLLAVALCLAPAPARALKVATWNLLDYQPTTIASRQDSYRIVMDGLDPDVLIVQEMNGSSASRDSFLNNVLNVVRPGQWTGAWLQLGTEGGAIFWKPAKVNVQNITSVATGGPRPVLVGLVKPVGYLKNPGWFRIYSVHLKAGTATPSTSDSTTRRQECTSLRTTLNNQVTTVVGTNFMIGGDTNFYGSWEGGYQRLIEPQLDDDGRGYDVLDMPGTWNNAAYIPYHTQSPRASLGGMDDRFDLFLYSRSAYDGAGLDVLPSTYLAYGNDGQHYNQDIDGGGFNNAVGLTIATALRVASDHVPAVFELQLPARVAAASQLAFGDVLVGASGVTLPLAVSNPGTVPAEALTYSLAAPAGFTAPAGPFSVAAGAPADVQVVGLDAATTGVRAGTLVMSTNAPDSLTRNVLLSGRVLAHASASLDSSAVVTSGSLDFGSHPAAGFADLGVRVHDQGWNALQAQLAVTAANVTGGDGRFSLPGFAPATLGATGRTFAVHFDPAGAVADSTYEATLTFTTADEALPGAQPAAPLSVSLQARVLGSTNGVPGGYALRLSPPRPNPTRSGAELDFELPREARVDAAIFDLSGRRVATLAAGPVGEGHHVLRWNARDDAGRGVPAGLYFVRFSTPGLTRVQRLALLP
ncbi:MAG: T9SS type A sorting domain-containing protein [Candidatus Eisenbacteria bacterium]|nr:T9SS type A sorting domain-containing protein [Candidatus Eisenbacteria bacterium]